MAVKLEDADASLPQVEHEYIIYQILGHRVGVPKVLWFGREGERHALVMELLGPSLHDHVVRYGPYPLVKVLSLAIQVVCMPLTPDSTY